MLDVGNNHITAGNHPFIALRYSKAPGDGFQWRVHGIIVERRFIVPIDVGDYQCGMDAGMVLFSIADSNGHHCIKFTIAAQREFVGTLINQFFYNICKSSSDSIGIGHLTVAAESDGHGYSSSDTRNITKTCVIASTSLLYQYHHLWGYNIA